MSYPQLLLSEDGQEVMGKLDSLISPCRLCPRRCGVDRRKGETGFCGLEEGIVVASYGPHFGEEPELVGERGSGTIFFSGCNLKCCYCQNYDISHQRRGREMTVSELAQVMLSLQERGCHNLNLVTPTHVAPAIVRALAIAAGEGLRLPLVYNCGGYESLETLRLLDGLVDVYMPDFKYWGEEESRKYSQAPDYPSVARQAVEEMHRQVGVLKVDARGLAFRGLLVRHLVLPANLARSEEILNFIARELSADSYVNIMDQYRPEYQAERCPELSRPITSAEYRRVLQQARAAGLHRGFPGDIIPFKGGQP